MKRTLAFILVTALLLPCLSGCSFTPPEFLQELLEENTTPKDSNNAGSNGSFWDGLFGTKPAEDLCIADQPKEVKDPLVISDALRTALDTSLILSPDSAHAFVNGEHLMFEGAIPVLVDDILLLPALAVTAMLGGQSSQNGESHVLTLGGFSLTLTPGDDSLLSGSRQIPLAAQITRANGDLLVSAPEFCEAIGQSMTTRNDLVFIGEDTGAIESEEAMGLVGEALRSEFSCSDADLASLGSVATGDGYIARADRSSCLVLSADMVPYTSANGETIAIAGSLYVEDLLVEGSSSRDDYYTCTMTVYNTGYTYGSIESFDANDNLIEFERVKPFEGQKSSFTKALTDMVVLGEDIYQAIDNGSWAELDYRSSLNASKTTVTLEVPKDGYIFVTCNPNHSERVAVYNATHTLFQLASIAQDVLGEDGSGVVGSLVDSVCEQILDNSAVATEIAMEFGQAVSSTETNPTNPAAYAQQMAENILTIFDRCEFDITLTMQNAAKELSSDALDKSAEGFLTKLLPAVNVAFSAWDISCTGSNTICLFMDLAYSAKTRSVIIEIGDWRAAYAQLLRERGNKGGEKFALAYINGDGIPELVAFYAGGHIDSYSEIYTYQKRQVAQILGTLGEKEIFTSCGAFEYAKFRSTLFWSDVSNGIVMTSVTKIENNALVRIEHFMDATVSNMDGEYFYNMEEVPEFYYRWKQRELEEEYGEVTILFNGYDTGWSINEENIRDQLKR